MPLVLHGGSGTGDENIKKACGMGINKVNLCSELLQHTYMKLQSVDWANDDLEQLAHHYQEGYAERLKEYFELSGSVGKAWTPERSEGLKDRKIVFGEGENLLRFL